MAGIKEAFKRVSEGKNYGEIIAMGHFKKTINNNDPEERYVMIALKKRKIIRGSICAPITTYDGRITVYNNSDVRIQEDLVVGDDVMLNITSNCTAEWRRYPEKTIVHKLGSVSAGPVGEEEISAAKAFCRKNSSDVSMEEAFLEGVSWNTKHLSQEKKGNLFKDVGLPDDVSVITLNELKEKVPFPNLKGNWKTIIFNLISNGYQVVRWPKKDR